MECGLLDCDFNFEYLTKNFVLDVHEMTEIISLKFGTNVGAAAKGFLCQWRLLQKSASPFTRKHKNMCAEVQRVASAISLTYFSSEPEKLLHLHAMISFGKEHDMKKKLSFQWLQKLLFRCDHEFAFSCSETLTPLAVCILLQ